jgi:hypothetical protein
MRIKVGRRICLVGFSEINRDWAMKQPRAMEIWGLNEGHNCSARLMAVDDLGREQKMRCPCYNPNRCKCEKHSHQFIPRYDRWFQIHPPNWKDEKRVEKANRLGDRIHERDLNTFGRNERHIKFLRECDKPVYMLTMSSKWGPFPSAVRYPMGKVEKLLGISWNKRKYLYTTSSPSYMVALAVYEHMQGDTIDEIRMAGIELAVGTEYFWQRACFEYYLGMAKGLGIKVTRPPVGSSLLTAPRYAIDDPIALPKDFTYDPQPIYVPTGGEVEAIWPPTDVIVEESAEVTGR